MSEASAKQKMKELATKAQEVVKDETKSFAERREELDKIEVDIKGYADEVAVHVKARELAGGAEASEEAKAPEASTQLKSLGAQVTEAAGFKAFAGNIRDRQRGSLVVDVKTVNTVDEGTGVTNGFPNGQGGAAVIPEYLPGIVDLRFRKLLIADLFAQGATSSNQISWVQETAFQNGAAGTAEKGPCTSATSRGGSLNSALTAAAALSPSSAPRRRAEVHRALDEDKVASRPVHVRSPQPRVWADYQFSHRHSPMSVQVAPFRAN